MQVTTGTIIGAAIASSESLKQDVKIECSYLEESTMLASSTGDFSDDTTQGTETVILEDTSEDAISDATTSVAYSEFNPGDENSHNGHTQHNRSTPHQTDLKEMRDMQSSRRKRRRDRDCVDGRGCEPIHIHIHGNYESPESGEKKSVDGRRPGSGQDLSSEKGSARRRSREWGKGHVHDDSSTDHSRSRSRSRSEETNDRVYREEDSSSSSDQYSSIPRSLSCREAGKNIARGCSADEDNDKGDITSSDRGRSRDKERERVRDRDRKWLRVRDSDRLGDEFRDLSSSDDTSPLLSESGSPKKSIAN